MNTRVITIKRVFAVFILCTVLFFIDLGIKITRFGAESHVVKSDAAIILGAGINYDQPSPVFRERIEHGLTLYRSGMVKYLIFTGGLGDGESFTESEVARIYAIDRGVQLKDIYLEKKSSITYENLEGAQKLLRIHNISSALVVSDPLHMKRSMSMAEDLGMNVNTAPTPTSMYRSWSKKVRFLFKEMYFYTGYLLRKWI